MKRMHVPLVGRNVIQIMVRIETAAFVNYRSIPFDVGDQKLLTPGKFGIDAINRAIPIPRCLGRHVTFG